jgi:hypothetical protein
MPDEPLRTAISSAALNMISQFLPQDLAIMAWSLSCIRVAN